MTSSSAPLAASLVTRSRVGKRLSLIAPCYNEQEVLDLFFARIDAEMAKLAVDYEIVCVNDGSRDHTLAVLLKHHQRDPRVKVINLARNFGKEVALSAGLDAAVGDMVVPIDVDLQDPPELIGQFIAAWEAGADVAYGVRVDRSADSPLKRFTAQGFYRAFNRLSDVDLPYNAGDYRLMDRRVVEVLRQLPERNRFMKGLFAWVGFRQTPVPYARPERAAGTSSWRYWKLWNFALDGITSFSTAPIRIWSYVGAVAGVLAVAMAVFIVARTLLFGRDVPGYPSLMVVILMSFGLQMLAIGALGEYVARIYQEVKGRPLYVVMDRYGFEAQEPA
ncbi:MULTISPECIES: glycosyltransferase family 2 protein [Caulobacter]|jgi:glycosyltransferase involved in cell wall biosynthesis|uniref:Glycosyl transferase n=1 Tax=Caulobacter vibrioides OR37 TaxID=1292034 RepID=R0CW41_CAUVI|nr:MULTISPECIES: glycosyltransferase family 2 protein [Caulobacter]ENZ80696.1 glycosyl transferase [Caulobacter vibrioides OR37]MBQ1560842.1 glycosyltransferase family 2 protein [Caulobacter sp.]